MRERVNGKSKQFAEILLLGRHTHFLDISDVSTKTQTTFQLVRCVLVFILYTASISSWAGAWQHHWYHEYHHFPISQFIIPRLQDRQLGFLQSDDFFSTVLNHYFLFCAVTKRNLLWRLFSCSIHKLNAGSFLNASSIKLIRDQWGKNEIGQRRWETDRLVTELETPCLATRPKSNLIFYLGKYIFSIQTNTLDNLDKYVKRFE